MSVTLKALVTIKDADKPKKGIKRISNIIIMAGPLHVGNRTLAGEFNERTAIEEFKRNTSRFTEGKGFYAAKMLKLF